MNPFPLLTALALVLSAPIALGQTTASPATPVKPPDITLVATLQYATRDYYAHTLDHTGPDFQAATHIFPGQRADLVVLAQNYTVNASGKANLVYDLDITYPGGRIQQAGHDLRLCVGPVPDVNLLAYAGQTASFSTEPGDPLGDYTFTVTVHDRVSGGAPVRKSVTLRVVPYAEPALPTGFNPAGWMTSYFINPSPALALPALFRISAALPRDNTDAWPAVLGFYEEVLQDNPWLAPVFLDRLNHANEADRTLLLFILGYAWRHDPTYAGLSKGPWPDADSGELNDPMQLDLLWGRFYATGAFAPVERVVSALRMHRTLGALERLKAANPAASLPSPEVMKELVLKSAQWSIGRNAREHLLVRHYCDCILAQKTPDTTFHALLAASVPDAAATPEPAPAEKPMVTFPGRAAP